jgi:hypothetical protein
VDGEEKLMVTGENLEKQEGKQQIHYALSIDFHEERKTLREGEDEAVKQDGASSEKQKKNFDMLNCQDVEEVSSMNKPSSMSMVERLTIQPTLALIHW